MKWRHQNPKCKVQMLNKIHIGFLHISIISIMGQLCILRIFKSVFSELWPIWMWKGKCTWKHFKTVTANQFSILVNIYYCYKVFNIYSFLLKTVSSNYSSDFDVLISIISILMSYIKTQWVYFLFHKILSFPWNF